MTPTAKKLLEDALALSEEERTELIAALSDSLRPPGSELSAEWKAEILSRIGEVERGEVEPVPWKEVQATIHATLAKRRLAAVQAGESDLIASEDVERELDAIVAAAAPSPHSLRKTK